MAYKISRSKKIVEDLELDGGPVLHVEIDVERISNDFNIAYNKVIAAEKALRELKADFSKRGTAPDVSIEKNYGEAVIELLNLVFGTENTEAILTYFEGHYIELTVEIFPFIINVVVPRIRQYVDEKRNKLASNYKASKRFGR
jgi:hypothetical protein